MTALVYVVQSLASYQMQLPDGTVTGSGTPVNISGITGLRSLNIRSNDAPRPGDGHYAGLNWVAPRVIGVNWELTNPSIGVESALQMVSRNWQNVPNPAAVAMTVGDYLRQQVTGQQIKPVSALAIQLPNRTYPLIVFGRPSKYDAPIDLNYQWHKVNFPTEWDSPDGLLYDYNVIRGSCTLPNPTAGAKAPFTFPMTFGNSTGGYIALNNTGAYGTTPVFSITGPCSRPTVTLQQTGEFVRLNLTLGATDNVIIDCQSQTVTLNATANRNNAVDIGSTFFDLAPGNNTVVFASIDSTAVAGTLTGYIMPAYSVI